MIPQDYIQEVVRRNDIEDVVQSYVQLRRRGRTCTGLCPFHTEKTPSVVVYPETQSFSCCGCGAGGDVITFIKKISNLEYVEAVKLLASRVGMPMPNEEDKAGEMRRKVLAINRDAARYFYDQLNKPTPEAALAREYWRKRRGLSDNTIRRFGLGYAPDSYSDLLHYLKGRGYNEEELLESGLVRRSEKGNLYNLFRHRMITPIIDLRGNVIAFGGRVLDDSKPKYINSPETVVYKKSRTLFALNIAKRSTSRRYILCEGYMDVISMHQAGFDTAVCACGTALTPEQVKLIGEYADEVILSYDSDEAGQKAAARSLELFAPSPARVSVLNIPGAKDPDEYIKKYGGASFSNLIDRSRTGFEFKSEAVFAKYDIKDQQGRLKAAEELVKIISEYYSSVEREIYISRAAEKLALPADVIKRDVEHERALRKREHSAELSRAASASIRDFGDRVNPDAAKNPRAASAEETVLGLLLLYESHREAVMSGKVRLESGDFFTDLGRRAFDAICALHGSDRGFDFTLLGESFSTDEISRLERCRKRREQLSENGLDVLEAAAEVLRREHTKDSENVSLADELEAKRRALAALKDKNAKTGNNL